MVFETKFGTSVQGYAYALLKKQSKQLIPGRFLLMNKNLFLHMIREMVISLAMLLQVVRKLVVVADTSLFRKTLKWDEYMKVDMLVLIHVLWHRKLVFTTMDICPPTTHILWYIHHISLFSHQSPVTMIKPPHITSHSSHNIPIVNKHFDSHSTFITT